MEKKENYYLIKKKLILNKIGETVGDEIEIGESDNGVTVTTDNEDNIFQGKYDLRYLSTFCKCTNLCSNLCKVAVKLRQ